MSLQETTSKKHQEELHSVLTERKHTSGTQHTEQPNPADWHVTPERAEEILATSSVFQGACRR